MGILQRIKQSLLAAKGGFEMSSSNGLLRSYALLRAKGEGGNPDPELEAVTRSGGHNNKAKSPALHQKIWLNRPAGSLAEVPLDDALGGEDAH